MHGCHTRCAVIYLIIPPNEVFGDIMVLASPPSPPPPVDPDEVNILTRKIFNLAISFKFYIWVDTPLRYFAIEIWYPPTRPAWSKHYIRQHHIRESEYVASTRFKLQQHIRHHFSQVLFNFFFHKFFQIFFSQVFSFFFGTGIRLYIYVRLYKVDCIVLYCNVYTHFTP